MSVVIPYELARFPSDGGSILLKIVREISRGDSDGVGDATGHFELLLVVDTEFVAGSGAFYADKADLAECVAFLTALDRGKSASWRLGKKGFGLLAEVVVDEAFGEPYDEIRITAVDADTGVTAGIVAYREDAWLAEARHAVEVFVGSR